MPMPLGRHDLQALHPDHYLRRHWSGLRDPLAASFSRLWKPFIRAEVPTFLPVLHTIFVLRRRKKQKRIEPASFFIDNKIAPVLWRCYPNVLMSYEL
jgi:hypothetical protein